jgi:hypothetical protein
LQDEAGKDLANGGWIRKEVRDKVLPGLLFFLHRATLIRDEPIQEIAQQLITALFIIRVVGFPEKRSQLAFAHFEIGKLQDVNDVFILQLESHADLF